MDITTTIKGCNKNKKLHLFLNRLNKYIDRIRSNKKNVMYWPKKDEE
tara:strand:+ start:420 stop:560 length:141 start_codon:yes stop_codon:yes gene_type:complete